ncbi:MAG: type II toxin-antitoxin system prevent-host-death family antitoxin, partial [Clostridia bacterium]|nr:type II toxin-antitoxin system prevent-host-death family antitoxin [Clostridia bacterium]
DLRNNYNEISKICHETKEPIFITKNGYNDLVLLSNDAYEEITETNEERIDRLVSEKFDQHYANFEEFKKAIFEEIDIALNEIKEGKGIPMEQVVAEMEAEYHFNE